MRVTLFLELWTKATFIMLTQAYTMGMKREIISDTLKNSHIKRK